MELFLHVKLSSLGTYSQRQRVESAFSNFICKNKVKTTVPNGACLGFPIKGKFPDSPINIINGYIENYSVKAKEETEDFIMGKCLYRFKKALKINTSLILIPLDNTFYVPATYDIVREKATIVNFKTTPKGLVAITKLNKWELFSYLDALVEMYKKN